MHNYLQLKIWLEAMDLVETIYKVTNTFPSTEKFGIVSQMTRTAVSIPSNIAEGAGRETDKEFCHFLNIATGSAYELHTQVIICERVGLITPEQSSELQNAIKREQQQRWSLRKKLASTNMSPVIR